MSQLGRAAIAVACSSPDSPSSRPCIDSFDAEDGCLTQRSRHRAQLIQRQLDALRWLEGLLAQSQKAGDSVAAWLNPTLAGHLEAADIFTLAQLVERINGVGRRWYAGIKAMGKGKGLRIVQWLQDVADEHRSSIASAGGRITPIPGWPVYADSELRKRAVKELIMEAVAGDEGPLIHGGFCEQEQRSFDSTCKKLNRFLAAHADDNPA